MPPNPNFHVLPCVESDIPRVFDIISLAFAHDHEYLDAVFPLHHTPSGRAAGTSRTLQLFQLDPNGHFVKCVDSSTGEIVGAAKWNIYKAGEVPPQPAIDGDYWETEEDKEFAQALFWGFFALRQRVIEELNGRLVALEMMMVDPKYQCQGAGRLLVQWGLKHADEMGVEAVVEGSERGQRLYQSEGFDGPFHTVEVPEKFANRRKQVYYFMRRPAKVKAA